MGRWAPSFFQRLEAQAQGFYQRLARVSLAFLHQEMELLRVLPRSLESPILAASPGEDSSCPWGDGP